MTRRSKIPCFNSCNLVRFGMRVFKDAFVVHDCHEYDGIPLIENQFMSFYAIKTIFLLGKNKYVMHGQHVGFFMKPISDTQKPR